MQDERHLEQEPVEEYQANSATMIHMVGGISSNIYTYIYIIKNNNLLVSKIKNAPNQNDKRISGTEPFDGRHSQTMQTDLWLEEIKGRVPEADVGVQTDTPPALSRPASPIQQEGRRKNFQAGSEPVPHVNKSTQILPDDPDLFVFNDEVVVV